MDKVLSVPYKSQWDGDAGKTANDCGPTSIAMILNYYEKADRYTTNEVFDKTGAGQGLISFDQLEKAISALGYTYTREYSCTPARLKQLLDQDTPPIALVKYGNLKSTQDKQFKGGHFFVPVGYRGDEGYFVNDSNFKDAYRQHGDHHFYTKEEFESAWSGFNPKDNPNNTLIVIHRKSGQVADDDTRKKLDNAIYNSGEYDKVCALLGLPKQDNYGKNASYEVVKEKFDEKDEKILNLTNDVKKLSEQITKEKNRYIELLKTFEKDEEEDNEAIRVGYEAQHERDALRNDLEAITVVLDISKESTREEILSAIQELQKPHDKVADEAVKQYLYKRAEKLFTSFTQWLTYGFKVWKNKIGGNK